MTGPATTAPSSPEELVRVLNVATRNLSMYSQEHPAFQRSLEKVEEVLGKILESRERINIQAAREHLMIEGRLLPPTPLLRSFASDLLKRGIQGITLSRGASSKELACLVEILGRRLPEGAQLPAYDQELRSQAVTHVRIHAVRPSSFDGFSLGEALLGKVLSGERTAKGDRDALAEYLLRDPKGVGRAISEGLSRAEGDPGERARWAAERLLVLLEDLLEGQPEQWERFRDKLAQVVLGVELDAQVDFFHLALAQGGTISTWIKDMTQEMPPQAVAEILARDWTQNREVPRKERLARYLLPDQASRTKLLPELERKLADYGVSKEEFLKILEQEHLSSRERAMLFIQGSPMTSQLALEVPALLRELMEEGHKEDVLKVVNRFLNGLNHPEWEVRKAVAQKVGEILALLEELPGSARIKEQVGRFLLKKALDEPDKEVFKFLLEVLEEEALGLISQGESEKALSLLQKVYSASSMEALEPAYRAARKEHLSRKLLSSPFWEEAAAKIRSDLEKDYQEGLTAVRLMGEEGARKIIELLGEEKQLGKRLRLMRALKELGEEALEPVRKGLLDSRWYLVRNLAMVLGELKDTRAGGPLMGLMDHPDPRVRREAIWALGSIGYPKAAEAAVKAMEDEDEGVRVKAVEVLKNLGSQEAVERIRSVLSRGAGKGGGDTQVRLKALRAMAELGQEEDVELIQELISRKRFFLRVESEEVRKEAVLALARIHRRTGSARALKSLKDAAGSDPSPLVRETARKAVEQINGSG